MDIKHCFKIGFILKPHGLKGAVTVSLDPEFPAEKQDLDAIFIDVGGELVPYFIESISVKGNKAYITFEDVDTLEVAESISKKSLYLPKSARPKSARGEFYDDEVVGFAVIDQESGELGTVTEVVAAGPNRLLAVLHQSREVLIPINGPFILGVNKSRKVITVSLPEGFLDI